MASPDIGSLDDLEQRAQSAPQQLGNMLQGQQQDLSSLQNKQNDPLELVKQNLLQQYQASSIPKASGGPVRRFLQNFLSGGAEAVMHKQGIETPQEVQQRTLSTLLQVQNAQVNEGYKNALTSQYQMTPVDLGNGQTVDVAAKDVGKIQLEYLKNQLKQQTENPVMPQSMAEAIGHPEFAGQPVNKAFAQIMGRKDVAEQGAENKTPNEIELIRRANAGDPEATAALSRLQQNRLQLAKERGIGYAQGRALYTPFETVVPGTNIPTTISNMQALKSGAPKVPLSTQSKLGGQYALYNDAYGILDNIDKLADKVDLDKPGVSSRIAAGYAAIKDPATNGLAPEVLSNILARQPINNQLSPDERDLVLTMAQGKAAGTGLRSILGQAGTNEMQQRLDSALFPGGTAVGSKQSVKQQTAATRKLLDRFAIGQPQVGLNAPGSETALSGRSSPGTTMIVTKPFRTAAGKVYNKGDRITVPATQLPKLKGFVTSAGR